MFQLEYDTKIAYVTKVADEMQKNHQEIDSDIITGFMAPVLGPG